MNGQAQVCPKLECAWNKKKLLVRTETRSVSVAFRFVSVFRTYIETTQTNRTVTNQTESNPKFSEKYQNMLSKKKLFRLVFCLFRFNRNIKTRCFGLEFETTETNCFETNQNKLKQTETTRNNTKFYEKIPIYALYKTVSVDLLFVSVQSKYQNSLFRFRSETTETNILFRIVLKLVSVPDSAVWNQNVFRRTPYPKPNLSRRCVPPIPVQIYLCMDRPLTRYAVPWQLS